MISKMLDSFIDNIKEKTSNPFLGTFIIVWVLKNWTLVFGIFNFDKGYNLQSKIDFIHIYYSNRSFVWNLIITVLISLMVLLLTYILLSVSRLLINFFEEIVTPRVYEITSSKRIVLKSEKDRIEALYIDLKSKYEDERKQRIDGDNKVDMLEKKIGELNLTINEKQLNIETITEQKDVALKTTTRLLNDVNNGVSPTQELIEYVRTMDTDAREYLLKTLTTGAITAKNLKPPLLGLLLHSEMIKLNFTDDGQAIWEVSAKGREFGRYISTVSQFYNGLIPKDLDYDNRSEVVMTAV